MIRKIYIAPIGFIFKSKQNKHPIKVQIMNGAPNLNNPKDRILELCKLEQLHYSNQLAHYIYRNTFRVTQSQRSSNFWNMVEIPTIVLAICELGILFIDLVWGFITLGLSALATFFIIRWQYNKKVKVKNEKDELIMHIGNFLRVIEYLIEEIQFIREYEINDEISEMIDGSQMRFNLEQFKIDHLNYYIVKILNEKWNMIKIENMTNKQVKDFFYGFNWSVDLFIRRLNRFKYFYEKNNLRNEESYKILDNMIKSLEKKK